MRGLQRPRVRNPSVPCAESVPEKGFTAIEERPGPLALAGVLQHERKVDRCKGVTILERRKLLREECRERLRVPGARRRVVALAKIMVSNQKHGSQGPARPPLRVPARRRLVATVEVKVGPR